MHCIGFFHCLAQSQHRLQKLFVDQRMRQTWITIQDTKRFCSKAKRKFLAKLFAYRERVWCLCVYIEISNICTPLKTLYTYNILVYIFFCIVRLDFLFTLHFLSPFFPLLQFTFIRRRKRNIIVLFCFRSVKSPFECGLTKEVKESESQSNDEQSWMAENEMQNRKLIDKSSLVSNRIDRKKNVKEILKKSRDIVESKENESLLCN